MGRPSIKINACLIAAAIILSVSVSMAAELSGFRISQVNAKLPGVKTYLNISDESGHLIQGVVPEQLTVTIGSKSVEVKTTTPFDATKEGVAYILLVDISKSLKESQFVKIREALDAWIDGITEKDRILLMTFGTQVTQVQDFTKDKDALKTKVSQIKPTDNDTRLYQGLAKAMESARRTDPGLPTRRVIVTMSDGENDFAGGMTRQEVLDRIKEEQVPIYSIGYYNPPYSTAKETSLKILGGFSRTSGGEYHKAGNRSFLDMYTAIRKRSRDVYVADLNCPGCTGDGRVYRLQMTISSGHRSMTDGKDIRLFPADKPVPEPQPETPVPDKPAKKPLPTWAYAAAGGGVLLLLLVIIPMVRRSKAKTAAPPESPPDTLNIDPALPSGGMPQAIIRVRLNRIGANVPSEPHTFSLGKPMVIGRLPSKSDIVLTGDEKISGEHCRFIDEKGKVYVFDLESRNGTLLNGVPITGKQRVEDGDMLLLGQSEFHVSISEETP